MSIIFSWERLRAIILKEFTQIKRDRVTFSMIIGLPLIQLILFGYVINTNPRMLPTAIISADHGVFTRNFTIALQNSAYFKIIPYITSESRAEKALRRSQIQFAIYIPQNFSKKLIHAETPQILVETDASDPYATGDAIETVQELNHIIYNFTGPLHYLQPTLSPVDLIVQSKYNLEHAAKYNTVPGLLGIVLTMTMVITASLAIMRERERGTMESLWAMPVLPVEVIFGKLIPYIVIGYIQVSLIILTAHLLFLIPVEGNLILLLLACLPFIAANFLIGLMLSTFAKNQLQVMQLAFFFFLPSILLSGFIFPFHGMPNWAQILGNILPLTHFLLIVRGILLKGNSIGDIISEINNIILFIIVVLFFSIKRYRLLWLNSY